MDEYNLWIYGYGTRALLYSVRYVGKFIGQRYGEGSGHIWLDDVECSGIEKSYDECKHAGWGVQNCVHAEDVSISCSPGIENKYPGRSQTSLCIVMALFSHWHVILSSVSVRPSVTLCIMLYIWLNDTFYTSKVL